MAIKINLEKYGHKKKGFVGFSWTSLFFNFLVPLFRLDIKWFLISILPYLFISSMFFVFDLAWFLVFISPFFSIYHFTFLISEFFNGTIYSASPIIIALIFITVLKIIFPFIYNHFYTKDLLKEGYLPPKDDDYSNAILKGNGYLEYTNEDLLDKEKTEKYRIILKEYEKERKVEIARIVIFFIILVFFTALFSLY